MNLNIAIITDNLSPYVQEPIDHEGKSSWDYVTQFISSLSAQYITHIGTPYFSTPYPIKEIEQFNELNLVKSLIEVNKENPCDAILIIRADTPFLNQELTQKMLENHEQYYADYSFSDGFPEGYTGEIISTRTLSSLLSLASPSSLTSTALFPIIQKDINHFAVETEIARDDMKILKLSLLANNKRNYFLLKQLEPHIRKGCKIEDILQENPYLTQTLPRYYRLQITEDCPQKCSYCPYPLILEKRGTSHKSLSLEDLEIWLNKITHFSDDAIINLSPWGEPSLHTNIIKVIEKILSYPKLSLVIETSGIGWESEQIASLIAQEYSKRIDWIISLDSLDEALYNRLREKNYQEANNFAHFMSENNKEHTYVQAVRMSTSMHDTENFYNYWQSKGANIIIQKYNSFAQLLEERQPVSLAPLKRMPCRILQREITISLEGNALLCSTDIEQKYIFGNINHDSLEDIWKKHQEVYRAHTKQEYPEICQKCDEFYVFNF